MQTPRLIAVGLAVGAAIVAPVVILETHTSSVVVAQEDEDDDSLRGRPAQHSSPKLIDEFGRYFGKGYSDPYRFGKGPVFFDTSV